MWQCMSANIIIRTTLRFQNSGIIVRKHTQLPMTESDNTIKGML